LWRGALVEADGHGVEAGRAWRRACAARGGGAGAGWRWGARGEVVEARGEVVEARGVGEVVAAGARSEVVEAGSLGHTRAVSTGKRIQSREVREI
jgi:hypothetical protein